MKKIYLFITLLSFGLQAQEINWISFTEALEAQKTEPKKIFMYVYANWCGPCKLLDKHTFSNKDLIEYVNINFYPVKFNGEGIEEIYFYDRVFNNPNHDPKRKGKNSLHELTRLLGISAFPAMLFFDEYGNPIIPVMGYFKPQQLEPYLKMINQEDYLSFSSQQDMREYIREFVSVFSN
tara:strand:+ start:3325 stop:3861 length:537 start_codon:yes stop_codon:yes gene_type:complete